MAKRRQRGDGGLFQRHDHKSCPPADEDGQRPEHSCRGRWVGRVDLGWVNGKRASKTVYGKTMPECRARLKTAQAAVAEGNRNTASRRLNAWLDYWLDEICPRKPKMKPGTLANYRSYCRNYLAPVLGRVKVDELAAQHVRQLHRYILDQGLSTTTAGHAHRILGTAMNDAMRDGWALRNPVELVPKPRNAPNGRRALSIEEVRRVFAVIEGDRLASRWHTAFLLGMRQGECLGLTWDRLDLDAGTVDVAWQLQRIPWKHGCGGRDCAPHVGPLRCPEREVATLPGFEYRQLKGNLCLVKPKTKGSSRLIALPEPLLLSLREHWAAPTPASEARLVWTTPTGDPIDGGEDRKSWHRILSAAGVEDTDQHSARHTTATLLLALGVPEDVRLAILGHSAVVDAYQHVDLSMQRAAMVRLGESLALTTGSM
jgi:integrase